MVWHNARSAYFQSVCEKQDDRFVPTALTPMSTQLANQMLAVAFTMRISV